MPINPAKPQSLADKEAEARKNRVLLRYAYLYDCSKGGLQPQSYRKVRPEVLEIFAELVEAAAKYKKVTGRHLPILGELGELFAEIMFGIKRHDPMTQGSDGKLGDDFVEVKTITPDKKGDTVQVKWAGNFGKLVVVKISDDFQFAARMVDRKLLVKGNGKFATLFWESMVAGEPDQEIHKSFPIKRVPTKVMDGNPGISNYLNEVLQDWQNSREAFPKNVHPLKHWPIPFFGNPATAVVATIGVNPSSGEFLPQRNWDAVTSNVEWKKRLKNYFNHSTKPHKWFAPWRRGLEFLGLSYEAGTVAHFDVSYRPTKAMLRNETTDPQEFSRMVERDVTWLFHLLPLCPNLRGLLTFGPIVSNGGRPENLAQFVRKSAPLHGFIVQQDGGLHHIKTKRSLFIHEVDWPGEKCVTCRVVKNLHSHRTQLRAWVGMM